MYRKFVAAFVALVITVGAVFAEEIKAVFVKYEELKLTVKVGDKEKTYDVDKDATVKFKFKDMEKEVPVTKMLERWQAGKGFKGDNKNIIITVEKDKVTGAKIDKDAK